MHYRFHSVAKHDASGKWEHVPRTGIGLVSSEALGDWTIEVSHRQVGVSIKRDQYSVTIRRQSPPHEELLNGFSSQAAAMAAGRKRVDLLSHVRQPVVRPPHRTRTSDVSRRP